MRTTAFLVRDSRGANLVEYILLVGVIALFAVAGFKVFGGAVNGKSTEQAAKINQINGR